MSTFEATYLHDSDIEPGIFVRIVRISSDHLQESSLGYITERAREEVSIICFDLKKIGSGALPSVEEIQFVIGTNDRQGALMYAASDMLCDTSFRLAKSAADHAETLNDFQKEYKRWLKDLRTSYQREKEVLEEKLELIRGTIFHHERSKSSE